MPATQMEDEVVNERPAKATTGRVAARAVHEELVSPSGSVKAERTSVVDENHGASARHGRAFKESTEKLFSKFEKEAQDEARKPAPHEEGDADDDDESGVDGEADGDADDDAGEDDSGAGNVADDDDVAEGGAEDVEDEAEADPAALTLGAATVVSWTFSSGMMVFPGAQPP